MLKPTMDRYTGHTMIHIVFTIETYLRYFCNPQATQATHCLCKTYIPTYYLKPPNSSQKYLCVFFIVSHLQKYVDINVIIIQVIQVQFQYSVVRHLTSDSVPHLSLLSLCTIAHALPLCT